MFKFTITQLFDSVIDWSNINVYQTCESIDFILLGAKKNYGISICVKCSTYEKKNERSD